MLKSYFQEYVDLNPSFGSFLGMRKYDSQYENVLTRAYDTRLKQLCKKYLKQDHNPNNIEEQTLQWVVRDKLEGFKYEFDLMPLTSYNNNIIQFSFSNSTVYPLKTANDLRNLDARYQHYIQFLKSCKLNMKKGISRGYIIPKMICKKMIKQFEDKNPREYITAVPRALQKKHPKEYASYLATSKMYSLEVESLIQFIKADYLKYCRHTYGLCHLPRGKEMYRYAVKSHLTMQTTFKDIEDIHQYGKTEVARITKEMKKLRDTLHPTSNMPQFYKQMVTDPRHQFANKDDVLSAYAKKRAEIRAHVIPKYFTTSVRPYDIKPVPPTSEDSSAGAFYMPSNSGRGTFYVNLRNLKDNLTYLVTPLALHEGEPGHHYQFQYMIDKKMPLQRFYAVDGCIFSEGWALYSELLYDYSNKPEDYFGKLTYELLRTVRLVVDTGIHYYGWSYTKAVNYMKKHIPMGHQDIENEVERYICMPGQALCYKIGERNILKWRESYLRKYGSDKIKEFHQSLLEDGILPLQVLEKKMMSV
jgi:uncharacterized protein (DUF885 family)